MTDTSQPTPFLWVSLVQPSADIDEEPRIRAWTTKPNRAEFFRAVEGLEMRPLYTEPLWCCHVRGPDEVYAAPDYQTALAWSDLLNSMNWRDSGFGNTPKPSDFKDPRKYADCLIKAVPAIWPHAAESHAADLPKSIAGFAMPATEES